MKRIKIILERVEDQEMLRITEPLFVGIVADRFVIEDNRRLPKKETAETAPISRTAVSAKP